MANNVVVSISAQDSATSVISGLGNVIEGATLKAQVLSQAIFTSLSSGLSAIGQKIKEASDIQLDAISAASTYSALTSRTFSDSTKVFAILNDKISKIATTLPGSTEQYKQLAMGIEGSLLPAFVSAKGVLNEGDFLKGLTEITRGMGFLGAASQIAARDVASFTSKFLNGSTIQELKSLSFADKNPAFLSLVERRLESTGKTLEQLTVKERAEILKAVQNKLITKDTINAASNSVSGITESFKDKLFNPSIGIFGLLKDIDKETGDKQSVLSAFNETLKALLDHDGLFATFGKTLGLFGFKDDSIIRVFRDGILSFNIWINSFNKTLQEINNALVKVSQDSRFNALIKSISDNLFDTINSFSDIINQKTINDLSETLAQLFNTLTSAILSIDYESLITILSEVIGKLFIGLGHFLSNINWVDFAKVLGVLLLGSVAIAGGIIVASLLSSLGIIGGAIVAAVIGLSAVVAANWDSIGVKITRSWDLVWDEIIGIGRGLRDNTINSGKFVIDIFNSGWDTIINFGYLIKSQWDVLTDKVTSIWTLTIDSIFRFFDLIRNRFDSLASKFGLSTKDINTPGAANNAVDNKSDSLPGLDTMSLFSGGIQNKSDGDSNFVSSVIKASNRELSNAPSGSSLVIANSSEAVLNQQQQTALLGNRGKSVFNVGSIVINTQATNIKDIADNVMNAIAQSCETYSSSNLPLATI